MTTQSRQFVPVSWAFLFHRHFITLGQKAASSSSLSLPSSVPSWLMDRRRTARNRGKDYYCCSDRGLLKKNNKSALHYAENHKLADWDITQHTLFVNTAMWSFLTWAAADLLLRWTRFAATLQWKKEEGLNSTAVQNKQFQKLRKRTVQHYEQLTPSAHYLADSCGGRAALRPCQSSFKYLPRALEWLPFETGSTIPLTPRPGALVACCFRYQTLVSEGSEIHYGNLRCFSLCFDIM